MPKKPNRAIVAEGGIVYGTKKYTAGQEDELAAACPQWNIDQMVAANWLTGDWSNAGLTPDEEADVAAKSTAKK